MKQIARNWTDYETGFLRGKRYLIHDRDPLFTDEFKSILNSGGVEVIKTSRGAPNMNAYAERFVWTIKHECLNHLILSNEKQLRYVIDEFMEYYHHERPHEGLGGKFILPWPQDRDVGVEIRKTERLGGLLKSYSCLRTAA